MRVAGKKTIRVRRKIMACVVLGVAATLVFTWDDCLRALIYHRPIRYDQPFGPAIAGADRIVVRAGGFDCCGPVDESDVLVEITRPDELSDVANHIQFVSRTVTNSFYETCMCCGGPALDWYRGKKRIAATAMQHGRAIRWRGFSTMRILGFRAGYGDGPLTPASREWLANWLATKGIEGPKEAMEADKRRAVIAQEARAILQDYVPQSLTEALKEREQVVEQQDSADMWSATNMEDSLKDEYIRASFGDPQHMYTVLFQILGCLPMHWDARYAPEQHEAHEFLVRAPRDELHTAIHAAATSMDSMVRRGAARLVYAQHYMTIHGKTEEDMAAWMGMLAATAYADPFPENRRLVMHRLQEFPHAGALDVLRQAVEDPDRVVRRKAISALAAMTTPERQKLLQQIAQGTTRPRTEQEAPSKNYGEGCGMSYHTPGMRDQEYTDTDAEAAATALQAPGLFADLGDGVTKRTWLNEDGTKWCEAYLLNGRSHGRYTEWWPDGTVKRTIEWRDNKRHGPTILFDQQGVETERIWYHDWEEVTEEEFHRRETLPARINQASPSAGRQA